MSKNEPHCLCLSKKIYIYIFLPYAGEGVDVAPEYWKCFVEDELLKK